MHPLYYMGPTLISPPPFLLRKKGVPLVPPRRYTPPTASRRLRYRLAYLLLFLLHTMTLNGIPPYMEGTNGIR